MKKIFTFIAIFTVALFANAIEENCAYFANSNVQVGAEGTIDLMINADNEIGSIYIEYVLPEGVTVNNVTSTPGANVNINEELGLFLLGNNNYYTTGKVATFHVSVADDVEIGDYPITVSVSKIVEPTLTTYTVENLVATLTVQKTAVIEPQDEDFSFDILPAQISSATTMLPILMKNKLDVASYTLEVTYPTGITPKTGRGSAPKVNTSNLYSTTDPRITALSVAQTVSGQVAKYTVSNAETDTYMAKDEYYEILQVPVTVSSTDAICNIKVKVSDIVAYDAENDVNLETPINVNGGEFMTTQIIGQPAAQEAILYGNYSSAVASEFSTALKNVAIADVTAATVDDGAKFTDVLVNEKGGNSYYTRTSANYGTTVLPLDLTAANVDELYMIESMDANSIVLTKAESVAANTPCIFKGTINVEGATPTLGVPSEQGLGQTTFKGTYSATSIADGAGYYISSNGKFYGDGATVRPFRGYFYGAIAGVKSFSVFVNTANGLVDITNQLSDEAIYSLQGIRTQTAKKGVNIVGGKKVYIK